MCQSRRSPLFLAIVVLTYLSLARANPVHHDPAQCLHHAQNLLKATDNMMKTAREKLRHYSCMPGDIDHEDITRDKTSTLKACLPLELAKNESCVATGETSSTIRGSCLPPQKASWMMTLCLSSIYEDLKMYQTEFQAIKAELQSHNQQQITLHEDMLAAIKELMRTLNPNGETPSQTPAPERADPYKVKIKLCILLHAFSIRVTTINKVMSYLNSS